MKIATVIAEYNPLHNGHVYHLNKIKEELKPEFTVIFMSGSVTERGDFAIFNRVKRAEHALKCGADAVFELPTVGALSVAQKFAASGVKMLKAFNNPILSFGSECGNINLLRQTADYLNDESEELKFEITENLDSGLSFVKSRADAVKKLRPHIAEVIEKPNNILAVEYINAVKNAGINCDFHTVKRENDYNSYIPDNTFASASAVRDFVLNGNFDEIVSFVPNLVFNDLLSVKSPDEALGKLALYRLNTMSTAEISELPEVSEGLENRIKASLSAKKSYTDLLNDIKTKRYTMARIKRIILYAILQMNIKKVAELSDAPPYFTVLSIKPNATKILSEITKNGYNVIFKKRDVISAPSIVQRNIALDDFAASVRNILYNG